MTTPTEIEALVARARDIDPVLEVEFDTQLDLQQDPYGATEAIEKALYLIRDQSTALTALQAENDRLESALNRLQPVAEDQFVTFDYLDNSSVYDWPEWVKGDTWIAPIQNLRALQADRDAAVARAEVAEGRASSLRNIADLTAWLEEDEDNGVLLLAATPHETIEKLRAILAARRSDTRETP
jgi:hypothetical protein